MNLSLKNKKILYKALRAVATDRHGTLRIPDRGICGGVRLYLRDLHPEALSESDRKVIQHYLYYMFTNWPEFSGDIIFPVKGLTTSPAASFHHSLNLWSRWTIYGRRRRRLLYWLLDTLDKDIRKHPEGA